MKARSILLAVLLLATTLPLRAQTPTPVPTPAPTVSPTPAPGYVAAFQTTPASPLANRQAHTATLLSTRMVVGEAQLLQNFRALYNGVWHNPDGLTPQQVCDALGPKASNLFVIAGTMASALYQIDPTGLGAMVTVPTGYTAAIDADGTVTITYTAPAATPTPTP